MISSKSLNRLIFENYFFSGSLYDQWNIKKCAVSLSGVYTGVKTMSTAGDGDFMSQEIFHWNSIT
jgi:hypothetical protein